jgi:hypothetical protein
MPTVISPSFYGAMFTPLFVAAVMVDRAAASASNGSQPGIPDVDCVTVSTEKNIHLIQNPLFSLNDQWFSIALKNIVPRNHPFIRKTRCRYS